jgi:hypothetical protein
MMFGSLSSRIRTWLVERVVDRLLRLHTSKVCKDAGWHVQLEGRTGMKALYGSSGNETILDFHLKRDEHDSRFALAEKNAKRRSAVQSDLLLRRMTVVKAGRHDLKRTLELRGSRGY